MASGAARSTPIRARVSKNGMKYHSKPIEKYRKVHHKLYELDIFDDGLALTSD